jgi:hypothetical protein
LLAMKDLTASALATLAANCDLSEDSDIKDILRDMSQVFEIRNDQLHKYQNSMDELQKSAKKIDNLADEFKKQLSIAGSIIAANSSMSGFASSSKPTSSLRDAEQTLNDVINLLDHLEVASDNSSKEVLKGVLMGIVIALKKGTQDGFSPVSYAVSSSNSSSYLSVPFLDTAKSTVMENVRQVVRNSEYFDPGGFWQVISCVTICLPVWLAYHEEQTKSNLIRGSLFLVKGANSNRYGDIARELAKAHPPSIQPSSTGY